MQSLIELKNISKAFGDTTVLDNFNLSVNENEFITLLGPSGCGKTTTLRIVGGFETPDTGKVFFEGKDITDLAPNKRHINTVFQKYALFPHMNVGDNIAFGLKIKGKSDQYIRDKIKYALNLVNLSGYERRRIDSLSGGQQQRIAIARAIVNEPKVLLLDEPLGALDLKLRQDMQYELIRLKNELGITFLYVTHDQEEAMAISDQIAVMKDGVIQQIGRPKELYHKPANEFVATFIGRTNIIPARLEKQADGAYIVFEDGYSLRMPALDQVEEQAIHVSIRPEEFIRDENGPIDGTITDSVYLGLNTEYFIETGFASKLQVSEESTFEEDLKKGDRVRLRINTQKLNVFSEDGSRNLIKGVSHGA